MNTHTGSGFLQKLAGMALGVLLAATFLTLTPPPAQAAIITQTVDHVSYEVDTDLGYATATDYDEAGGTDPVIQASVNVGGNSYPVTAIGDQAFASNHLTSVSIPDSLTTIGEEAFIYNQLTSVSIPDSLTTIGEEAFSWNQLTSVSIPNSVTTIGDGAFAYNQLTSVNIPSSLTTIPTLVFMNNKFTEIVIPDWVTTIDMGAFAYNQLASVVIPDSVTTIGYGAFAYNQLTSVDLPSSLTTIPYAAFMDNKFTEIVIPDSVTTIGEHAFVDNPLTRIEIPPSVQNIGAAAFRRVNEPTAPHADVYFTGVTGTAPTVTETPGQGATLSSFNPDATLYYYSERGSDRITGGFDTPTWQGYNTVPIFKVTFDTNGGTAIPADQQTVRVVRDQFAVAPTTATTRAGYSFTGWAYATAPTVVVDLATTAITADTTFQAVWNVAAVPTLINTATSTTSTPLAVTAAGLLALGALALTRSRKKRA